MSKEGGNGVAGASAMQYSEFLQNVHSAWLTGINPYDGYYGIDGDLPSADDAKEQGLFGRIRSRIFDTTAGSDWDDIFGSGATKPYPNVADAIYARVGVLMDIVNNNWRLLL